MPYGGDPATPYVARAIVARGRITRYPQGIVALRASSWLSAARPTLDVVEDTITHSGTLVRDTQRVTPSTFNPIFGGVVPDDVSRAAGTLTINIRELNLIPSVDYLVYVWARGHAVGNPGHRLFNTSEQIMGGVAGKIAMHWPQSDEFTQDLAYVEGVDVRARNWLHLINDFTTDASGGRLDTAADSVLEIAAYMEDGLAGAWYIDQLAFVPAPFWSGMFDAYVPSDMWDPAVSPAFADEREFPDELGRYSVLPNNTIEDNSLNGVFGYSEYQTGAWPAVHVTESSVALTGDQPSSMRMDTRSTMPPDGVIVDDLIERCEYNWAGNIREGYRWGGPIGSNTRAIDGVLYIGAYSDAGLDGIIGSRARYTFGGLVGSTQLFDDDVQQFNTRTWHDLGDWDVLVTASISNNQPEASSLTVGAQRLQFQLTAWGGLRVSVTAGVLTARLIAMGDEQDIVDGFVGDNNLLYLSAEETLMGGGYDNHVFHMRVQRTAYVWRARAWMDGDAEPGTWTHEARMPTFLFDFAEFAYTIEAYEDIGPLYGTLPTLMDAEPTLIVDTAGPSNENVSYSHVQVRRFTLSYALGGEPVDDNVAITHWNDQDDVFVSPIKRRWELPTLYHMGTRNWHDEALVDGPFGNTEGFSTFVWSDAGAPERQFTKGMVRSWLPRVPERISLERVKYT